MNRPGRNGPKESDATIQSIEPTLRPSRLVANGESVTFTQRFLASLN